MSNKEIALSRVAGVEEHVTFPELISRLPEEVVIARGNLSRDEPYGKWSLTETMGDTEARLKALDVAGVTVQILSYPSAAPTFFRREQPCSGPKR